MEKMFPAPYIQPSVFGSTLWSNVRCVTSSKVYGSWTIGFGSEDSEVGERGNAIGTVELTGSYAYGSMVPIACSLSPTSEF